MKILKWALIIWIFLAFLVVLVSKTILRPPGRTETYLFCAYNRVFVEFEENGQRWGTLMLDLDGRPIPCHEQKEVEIGNTI